MGNLKLKVHWFDERVNENDDNNGRHFGIYVFNCLEEDYDGESGYGSYDILDVIWFNSKDSRDKEFKRL